MSARVLSATDTKPSTTNCSATWPSVGSTNCGTKARKKSATFGLRTFVISPCRKAAENPEEARRFQAYEAARYRVLLLEHYFYPEVMGAPVAREWRRALVESLQAPFSYPRVAMLGALGWRLRRNYVWIYVAVLVTWAAKIQISLAPGENLIAGAAIGQIPGVLVWALVIVFYIALIAIAVLAKRTYPMGSEAARAVLSQEPD